MTHALVVATQNRGKLAELRALLSNLSVTVLSSQDVTKTPIRVVEDGATFEDNAKKKAETVAGITRMLTLADDSGLEVDLLNGAPGVHSARFAGDGATDAENNAALLDALNASDLVSNRSGEQAARSYPARFRCVLALVDPFLNEGAPIVVEGACEGAITRNARGAGGFGYDPIFIVGGTDQTMAELDSETKNRVSHRARAFDKLRLVLEKVLAERDAVIGVVEGP